MTADQGTSHSHTYRELVYNPNIYGRPQRSMTASVSDTSAEQEEKNVYKCRVQVCPKQYANPSAANRHMAKKHNVAHNHVSMYNVVKEPNAWHCRIGLCTHKLKTMAGMDQHMKIVHDLALENQYMFDVEGPSIAEVRVRWPNIEATDNTIMDVIANNTANDLKVMEKAVGKLAPAEPKVSNSLDSCCILFIDVVHT